MGLRKKIIKKYKVIVTNGAYSADTLYCEDIDVERTNYLLKYVEDFKGNTYYEVLVPRDMCILYNIEEEK